MRVEGLGKGEVGERVRVQATVVWEDADLPAFDLHFETSARFGDDIECNPNAFLLASLIPAIHLGERRVRVEGALCPQLRSGLLTAVHQLAAWYGREGHEPVEIEATEGFVASVPDPSRRTASFMSGGIDAMAALRRNRLDLPLDHPGSIRDCLFVHGLDIAALETLDANLVHYEWAREQLERFGALADFTLLPVYTNAPHLGGNYNLFVTESHGAVIASIAHVFRRRIGTAIIPSSESVFDSSPWGSSPLLDPHYASADLTIKHDSTAFNRLEKVAFVAQWDEALAHLRSCFDPLRGRVLNCGQCEKCLRTMTALLLCDKLDACPTFPANEVTAEALQPLNTMPAEGELPLLRVAQGMFWEELIGPLRERGRADLAAVVEAKIAESERARRRREGKGWKAVLRRGARRLMPG